MTENSEDFVPDDSFKLARNANTDGGDNKLVTVFAFFSAFWKDYLETFCNRELRKVK